MGSLHFLLALLCFYFTAFSKARKLSTEPTSSKDDDILGLIGFKHSSIEADPHGFLTEWTPSSSLTPCSWRGVTCSSENRVTELNLTWAGLIGHLQLSDLMAIPKSWLENERFRVQFWDKF
ncbi:hypothetical protein LguiA_034094 [Lonicera macranthoides]